MEGAVFNLMNFIQTRNLGEQRTRDHPIRARQTYDEREQRKH